MVNLYVQVCQVDIEKKMHFLSEYWYFFFTLTNSVDPDEMPHYAAFHQALHCL